MSGRPRDTYYYSTDADLQKEGDKMMLITIRTNIEKVTRREVVRL
jgi:hypothetical protein